MHSTQQLSECRLSFEEKRHGGCRGEERGKGRKMESKRLKKEKWVRCAREMRGDSGGKEFRYNCHCQAEPEICFQVSMATSAHYERM